MKCLEFPLVVTIALLCQSVLSNPTADDLSNERLPSTTSQREQHWQIDCTVLRRYLLNYPGGSMKIKTLAPQLVTIKKCAMIHNVPGTPREHSCPNYARVHKIASTALANGAKRIKRSEISAPLTCT